MEEVERSYWCRVMLGVVAAMAASLLWSLNPAVISRYRRSIKPISFTGVRALIALLPLLIFLPPRLAGLSVGLIGWLIVVSSAVIGPGLGDSLYTYSIKTIGGSLAVVISYTYIFFTQLFSHLLAGETPGFTTLVGAIIAFTGIAVGVRGARGDVEGRSLLLGSASALSAGVSWGLATALVKASLRYIPDTLLLTAIRLLAIAATLIPLGYLLEGWYDKSSMGGVLKAGFITGFFGWTIGMLLFIYSISLVGASLTAVATALTPVFSQVTTSIVSREKPRAGSIIGSIIVMTGIIVAGI